MRRFNSQFAWKEDFPPVYGHTSISFLKNCPGYFNAKNGDMNAALQIAATCAKKAILDEIRLKYPNAILLPVTTSNKLPEALAVITGLKYFNVYLRKSVERKSLSAMERLLHTPAFYGNIMPGETYIIVDDIVTQGGTISALRKYIISRGGTVIAAAALAYSVNSHVISPDFQDIADLMIKFNSRLLYYFLRKHCVAENLDELTNSQIKYLLKFGEVDRLTDKMLLASTMLNRKGYGMPAEPSQHGR